MENFDIIFVLLFSKVLLVEFAQKINMIETHTAGAELKR